MNDVRITYVVQRGVILEIHRNDGGVTTLGLLSTEKLVNWTENTVTTERRVGSTIEVRTYDAFGMMRDAYSYFAQD